MPEPVGLKVLLPTFVKVWIVYSPLVLIVPPVALIEVGAWGMTVVTLTEVVTVLKLAAALGVKVTLWLLVPAAGAVDGLVKAKVPEISADPPVKVDESSVCPWKIELAVGTTLIVGVTFSRLITTVWLPSLYPVVAAATARTVT